MIQSDAVKLSKYSLDQITQTKSRYKASASAYVLCPLAMQRTSISGSAGWDQDVSRECEETELWGEAELIFKLLKKYKTTTTKY